VIEIPDDIKVLSVRQPWAWCLVHGLKDVENRSRRTNYRGPVLIHASGTESLAEYQAAWEVLHQAGHDVLPLKCELGGIVGIINITDCVQQMNSPWFFGPFGWVVTGARKLAFIPCKGQLGFWSPPADVLESVKNHLMMEDGR